MARGRVNKATEFRSGATGRSAINSSVWKKIPFWYYVLGGFAAIIVALLVVLSVVSNSDDAGSPSTASSLSSIQIGESAPGFSLQDPYGNAYAFTPGDGKAHLLVFYMGYF